MPEPVALQEKQGGNIEFAAPFILEHAALMQFPVRFIAEPARLMKFLQKKHELPWRRSS